MADKSHQQNKDMGGHGQGAAKVFRDEERAPGHKWRQETKAKSGKKMSRSWSRGWTKALEENLGKKRNNNKIKYK